MIQGSCVQPICLNKEWGLQIRCLTHKNMLVWQYDRMTQEKNWVYPAQKNFGILLLLFFC